MKINKIIKLQQYSLGYEKNTETSRSTLKVKFNYSKFRYLLPNL